MEPENTSDSVELDLGELGALFRLLRDNDVASFAGYGIQVAFREDVLPPVSVAPIKTADATSNKPVPGFKSDFHNPSIWPHQNGKTLRFDGTLE